MWMSILGWAKSVTVLREKRGIRVCREDAVWFAGVWALRMGGHDVGEVRRPWLGVWRAGVGTGAGVGIGSWSRLGRGLFCCSPTRG